MSHEKQVHVLNGWAMLAVTIADFLIGVGVLIEFVYSAIERSRGIRCRISICSLAACWWSALGVFLCNGFFTLQPNEGRVLILFGAYRGTVRQSRLALDESAEHQEADFAAGEKPQRRQAESQRQTRQPH